MIYFPMTCGLRIECLPAPPSCTRHVCVLYSVELTLKLEVALDEAGAIHTRARNIRNHRCTPTAATMSEPNLEYDACFDPLRSFLAAPRSGAYQSSVANESNTSMVEVLFRHWHVTTPQRYRRGSSHAWFYRTQFVLPCLIWWCADIRGYGVATLAALLRWWVLYCNFEVCCSARSSPRPHYRG